jgi:hypothetical protein
MAIEYRTHDQQATTKGTAIRDKLLSSQEKLVKM